MKKSVLSLFFIIFILQINAQKNDDKVFFNDALIISPSYSFQLPLNDMFHSYGFNHNLGIEFSYKFEENWIVGVEGNFLFGSAVKDTLLLKNILIDNAFAIGTDGSFEEIELTGRGSNFMAKVGKIFYFSPEKPNSGLMLKFGIGYLDHKIFINRKENNVPQLSNEIITGYDRYTNGIAFSQYIGLIQLEKKKFLNMSFGIEATQGITQNRRAYDFSSGMVLDKTRFDFLIGFKFNWYLPVYMGKNSKSEYFYY